MTAPNLLESSEQAELYVGTVENTRRRGYTLEGGR